MKNQDPRDLLEHAADIPRQRIRRDLRRASGAIRPLLSYLVIPSALFDPLLNEQLILEKRPTITSRETARIVFSREMGETPFIYATSRRLETAVRLLRETDLLVREVARLVGLKSSNNLTRALRHWCGLPAVAVREGRIPATGRGPGGASLDGRHLLRHAEDVLGALRNASPAERREICHRAPPFYSPLFLIALDEDIRRQPLGDPRKALWISEIVMLVLEQTSDVLGATHHADLEAVESLLRAARAALFMNSAESSREHQAALMLLTADLAMVLWEQGRSREARKVLPAELRPQEISRISLQELRAHFIDQFFARANDE